MARPIASDTAAPTMSAYLPGNAARIRSRMSRMNGEERTTAADTTAARRNREPGTARFVSQGWLSMVEVPRASALRYRHEFEKAAYSHRTRGHDSIRRRQPGPRPGADR